MNAAELHLPHDLGRSADLGIRHGESDPAMMLGRVLLLLAGVMVLALAGLVWWWLA